MKRILLVVISLAFLLGQTHVRADDSGLAAAIEQHNKVIKELNDELKQAQDRLVMELKTCTDKACRDAQQADYHRTKRMIATQMLELNLAFMLQLAKMGQSEAESIVDDIKKIEDLGGGSKDPNSPSKGSPGGGQTSAPGTLVPKGGIFTYTDPTGKTYTFPAQITQGGVVYHIVPTRLRSWTRPYVEYQSGNNYYVMLGTPSAQ